MVDTTPIVALLVFLAAALTWSFSGIVSDWRRNKGTPAWKGISSQAVKDDLILGGILGIAAFAYAVIFNLQLPAPETIQAFILAIPPATGIVALADKIIVRGLFNK